MKPETILELVIEHTGVSEDEIKSKTRKLRIQKARNLYCYLCKHFHSRLSQNLVYSMRLINRTSYTIYNSYRRIKGFMDSDVSFELEVLRLQKTLLPKRITTPCNPCKSIFIGV